MRNRFKTLLTQFSIRDLHWATIVAVLVVCLVHERVAMRAKLAAEREAERAADQAKLPKQLQALETQKAKYDSAWISLLESSRSAREEAELAQRRWEHIQRFPLAPLPLLDQLNRWYSTKDPAVDK